MEIVISEGDIWPIAFGGHAGWLHAPPRGQAGALGVVLCAPLGRDARCAHRPLRLLAQQLSAAGVCVLRYDHLGAGDALDLPEETGDALAAWREGVALAVETLKALTGVERVVLAGLRFGATLAALEHAQADGLALLAPIMRGRAWLRELAISTSVLAPASGGAVTANGLDVDGLVMSAPTVEAVSGLDLAGLDLGEAPIFIAAQTSAARALATSPNATLAPFEGFDALFDDAHSNRVPQSVFDALTVWVTTTFAEALGKSIDIVGPADVLFHPPGAVERPVQLGNGLRGVLCAPAQGVARMATAVVLGNTGGDPRAGIGGFATGAARALARAGVMSLRLDFAGLGDSPAADGAASSHIYETPRGADIEAGRALLAAEGAEAVIVSGVCSGGYHAVHAALDNSAIAGVFAVNTAFLSWRAGASLAVGQRDQGRSTKAYLQRAADPRTWLRLVRGGLDVPTAASTLRRRLRARLAARAPMAPEARVKAGLAALTARGGRICWIVGAEDPALDLLEAHFGPNGRALAALPGTRVRIVEGLDHGLALSASRAKARAELLAFVAEIEAGQRRGAATNASTSAW